MSVINQMLRDLDKRQARPATLAGPALHNTSSSRRWFWWLLLLPLLLQLSVIGVSMVQSRPKPAGSLWWRAFGGEFLAALRIFWLQLPWAATKTEVRFPELPRQTQPEKYTQRCVDQIGGLSTTAADNFAAPVR